MAINPPVVVATAVNAARRMAVFMNATYHK
jgi:hypothetical protein